jgi:hypothetical protein
MNFKINPVEKLALVLGANEYVKEIAQKTGQQIQPLIPLTVGQPGSGHIDGAARILGKAETEIVVLNYSLPSDIVGIPVPNIINPLDLLNDLFGLVMHGNIPRDRIDGVIGDNNDKAVNRNFLPKWVGYKNVIFDGIDKVNENVLADILYVILEREIYGYPLEDKVFILCAEPSILTHLKHSSVDTYRLLREFCVIIPFPVKDLKRHTGEKYGLNFDETSLENEDKEIIEFQMGEPPQLVKNYIEHFVDYLLGRDEVKDKGAEDKISYVNDVVSELFYYYDLPFEIETIVRQKLFK